jgi:hypothetical protein
MLLRERTERENFYVQKSKKLKLVGGNPKPYLRRCISGDMEFLGISPEMRHP